MSDHENLHKELDLVQDCIKRMANNSFLLKGWTLSLLTVIIALAQDVSQTKLIVTLIVPTLCFWYLNAYFLRAECRYRKLYGWVVVNRPKTVEHQYDLNPGRFDKDVAGILELMFSKTLSVFYGIPLLALTIFACLEGLSSSCCCH